MYFILFVLVSALSLFGSEIERNCWVTGYDTKNGKTRGYTYNIISEQLFNDLTKLHLKKGSFTANESDNSLALMVSKKEIELLDKCFLNDQITKLDQLVDAWIIADKLSLRDDDNLSMNELTQKILASEPGERNLFLEKNEDKRDFLVDILVPSYLSYYDNVATRLKDARVEDINFGSIFLKTIGMPLAIIASPFYFLLKQQGNSSEKDKEEFYGGIENYVNETRLFKIFGFASNNKITKKFLGLSFLCFFFTLLNVKISEKYDREIVFLVAFDWGQWLMKTLITKHTNISQNLLYSLGLYNGYKLFSYFMRTQKNDWDPAMDNTLCLNKIEKKIEDLTDDELDKYNDEIEKKIWCHKAQNLYSYFDEDENMYYTKEHPYVEEKIQLPNRCVACLKISDNLFVIGDATQKGEQHEIPEDRAQYKFPITTLWFGEKQGDRIEKRAKIWEPLVDDLSPSIAPIIRTGNWKTRIEKMMTRVDENGLLYFVAKTAGEQFSFPLMPTNDPLQLRVENIKRYKMMQSLKEVTLFILFWPACHFIHIPTALVTIKTVLQKWKTNVLKKLR